jgi:hypothetical protein
MNLQTRSLESGRPLLPATDLPGLPEKAVVLCGPGEGRKAWAPWVVGREQELFPVQDRWVLASAVVRPDG